MEFSKRFTEAKRDAFAWWLFTQGYDYEVNRPRVEWVNLMKQFKSFDEIKP
jgi:hypothetical protein